MLNEANDYVRKISQARSYRKLQAEVAKKLRTEGYTIREIAATLGYRNPGSISHLLK